MTSMSLRTNKGKDFSLNTKDLDQVFNKETAVSLAQGQVGSRNEGDGSGRDCWEKGMVDKIQKRLSNFETQKS